MSWRSRLIILVCILPLYSVALDPPKKPILSARPWLRICDSSSKDATSPGTKFFLTGSECSGGYMFTKALPGPICVCGNGLWVLKEGYCDTGATYVIFAQENQCFSIAKSVRWIRYIGHPERAKVDSHYIASEYFDYFEKLRKNEPSRLIASKVVWTLAVGDGPENIYLPQDKVCFHSDWRSTDNGNPYARVGRSPDPTGDAFPNPYLAQQLSYCPYFAKAEQTAWIYGGGMLMKPQTGPALYYNQVNETVIGKCNEWCSNVPPFEDKDYTTPAPVIKSPQDLINIIDQYPYSEEDSLGKQMSGLAPLNSTYSSSTSVCKVDNATSAEIDLQTLRMIRSQTAYSLRQLKSSTAFMEEYKYLQRARMLLTFKCPALPATLIKSFIRMFRFVLLESTENHPYRRYGQPESHARIMESMLQCYNFTGRESLNFTFEYLPNSCPQQLSHTSYTPLDEAVNKRNCSMKIPQELKFDSCKHDLVTEVTWKVILFAHYFCSRHMANFSQDHSEFYATMERLFNPDVLMRYYNPGKSYQGMKFVFQMYNLDEFMSSLDKCVACARDTSQYRAWLKRPRNVKMCKMIPDGGDLPPIEGYNFNIGGYTAIPRNPLSLPYQLTHTKKEYLCYGSWKDGLYTRPRQNVTASCGLGMHVLGETVSF